MGAHGIDRVQLSLQPGKEGVQNFAFLSAPLNDLNEYILWQGLGYHPQQVSQAILIKDFIIIP